MNDTALAPGGKGSDRQSRKTEVRALSGAGAVTRATDTVPMVNAEDVKRQIEVALKRRAEVKARSIHVAIGDDGRVILCGTVESWDERAVIKEAVWSMPGVGAIEDRLGFSS
ncbi:MAG TPA: BON domain-containing protein [Pseudolabrys sp.]|nr:BON domain-containing protein [Pseudolabrys sp.]